MRTVNLTILIALILVCTNSQAQECSESQLSSYPIMIYDESYRGFTESTLKFVVNEVLVNKDIDVLAGQAMTAVETSFVKYINDLRRRDYSAAYLSSNGELSSENFPISAGNLLEHFGELGEVTIISKICLEDSIYLIWKASPTEGLVFNNLAMGYEYTMNESGEYRWGQPNNNMIFSAIKDSYTHHYLQNSSIAAPGFDNTFEFNYELNDADGFSATGITLQFNGTSFGVSLSDSAGIEALDNEVVDLFLRSQISLADEDLEGFRELHTLGSSNHWASQFANQPGGYIRSQMLTNPLERHVVFLMDAGEYQILFYYSGSFGFDYLNFMRDENYYLENVEEFDLSAESFPQIGLLYSTRDANGLLKITKSAGTDFIARLLLSNNLFVTPILRDITIPWQKTSVSTP